ncbi:MAG: hypothetical protein U0U67_10385 [Chitinophagales bacterium]
MKKLQTILIALLFTFNVSAQDFAYEGPAKSEVKSFWINAMGIQKTGKFAEGVAVLEAKMAAVKQKDPAYKTDKMEAEIAKWKAKAGTASSSNSGTTAAANNSNLSPTQKSIKADKLMRSLFVETPLKVNQSDVPVMEFRFKEYTDKLQELIDLNTRPNASDIKYIKTYIASSAYGTNQLIGNIEAVKTTAGDLNGVAQNYYLAKYHQLYWDAAQKIFPEETDFADEYKKITALVAANGSLEDMKAGTAKNNEQEIKNRKLPTAVMKDAAAEKMMIDAFNKMYKNDYNGTAYKAVILQSDWHSVRHEISGIITGRQRQFAVVFKGNDNKCYLVKSIYLYQEFNGQTYINTIAKYAESPNEILCENVK